MTYVDQELINEIFADACREITADIRARRIARGEPIDDLECEADKKPQPKLRLVWSRE